MNKQLNAISGSFNATKKIYVVMVGAAPMASLDALMLSLERFKGILSSDSAKESFETAIRTVKSSITDVNQFIEAVYAQHNPNTAINMKGRTLIVEVGLSKEEFLESIYIEDVEDILKHINAVGTMPAKRAPGQPIREYSVYPVKYANGRFIKFA